MKICLVNSLFKPYSRGGAEVVVEIICRELVNQGHQVTVITIGRKKSVAHDGPLTIYRLKPLNIFSFLDINTKPTWERLVWHILDTFNISSYLAVKKILNQERPDVVMTHNIKGIGYLVPRAIKKLGMRHWHTVHDVQLSRPSGLILVGQEKPFLLIDKIYEKICRQLFGSPAVVISPSRWLLNYYATRGFFYHSEKIVLPNPVVFRKVEGVDNATVSDGVINLLYVGQLERFKGILFLISALKKVPAKNWRLRIVGSGRAQKQIEQLIQDDSRFVLVGRVEPNKVIDYYRQTDLTIVPSLCYENSPAVIYESLVANTPVIAADIGGIPEMVKDDYNGFTFVPGDEKNFIEVIEHFLRHPENIEQVRKNCFISVRNYSVASYVKQLLSHLG